MKQLEAMKFLLRQSIALRCHSEKEGNLRQLLTWLKDNAVIKSWIKEGKYVSQHCEQTCHLDGPERFKKAFMPKQEF